MEMVFFHSQGTKDTIIVRQMHISSSKKGSAAQPFLHDKPEEEFLFVLTGRLPERLDSGNMLMPN